MSRLPALAFAALVAATVAAFFVTQHLKVSTPLLAGRPAPVPAYINPANPKTCLQQGFAGPRLVNHGRMRISFYLLHQSDDVRVTIVNSAGRLVRTIATKRHMIGGAKAVRSTFFWDGRLTDGAIAPDGPYYIHVTLLDQDRTLVIATNGGEAEAVTVKTRPPTSRVTGVLPNPLARTPEGTEIHYAGNQGNRSLILIYRSDARGGVKLVKSFPAAGSHSAVHWDGLIHGRPAPQGTYLVGIQTTDPACNTTHYPATVPPVPGSTPHAGVTVQYLAAEPPLLPIPAGRTAAVSVRAGGLPYRYQLLGPGARAPVAQGAGRGPTLGVSPPAGHPGLYRLSLVRQDGHRTAVPVVASAATRARVLIVLPALTWQGLNPVDANGDGLPETLDRAVSISLSQPLLNGLPAGFGNEQSLLGYADRTHLAFDLTTDLALAAGRGPRLQGHSGVILAGTERWLWPALGRALRSYVNRGGRLLSLGTDSLRRPVTLKLPAPGSLAGAAAQDPGPATARDIFGVPAGTLGTTRVRIGSGTVTEAPGLIAGVAENPSAQAQLRRLWGELSRRG